MLSLPITPSPGAEPARRRRAPGFSLVEVILALGIMGITIISVLGLIAPTLNEVQYTQALNAGTSCISKMNSLIETAPFWSSGAATTGESVWQWVVDSHSNSPTVFLFYDEIPNGSVGGTDTTPVQHVIRFNITAVADTLDTPDPSLVINTPDPTTPRFPYYPKSGMADFLAAVNESRISGPVIAMTLSLSPLVLHFPNNAAPAPALGGSNLLTGLNEQQFYVAPTQNVLNGLFPDNAIDASILADPDGTGGRPYPEAYLPIYIQAFNISTANLQSTAGIPVAENQIISTFSTSNRLFTYTTAKLR